MIPEDPDYESEVYAAEQEPILLELSVGDQDDKPKTSLVGIAAGATLSILFHLWLVFTMAGMFFDEREPMEPEPIETAITEPTVPEEEEKVVEIREFDLANPSDRESENYKSVNAASIGMEHTSRPTLEVPSSMVEMDLAADMKRLPVYDIPQGLEVSKTVVVPGTTGEALIQLDAALDRVSWEIARNLQEKKVLVVWVLDASGSIVPQRQALVKRLRRIYTEINALEQAEQIPRMERGLLSGVVSFGSQTTFITKEPTDKFDDIVNAVQSTATDTTGVENVFAAINQIMDNWHKYRIDQGRRIMLIVLTDEAGDDHGMPMEVAINKCQKYGAKAYVVGPAAPFGHRKGYVPYVAKENGKTYQIPVDLGPESVVVENVDLPYWYEGPQLTYLSSGFGPYALNRLVKETGGVYFMTNMTTNSGLSTIGDFDPGIMKAFEPDYQWGSPDQFMKDLMKHPLRAAVVAMAEYSQTTNLRAQGTPQLEFKVQANNFRQMFADAQKSAAISSLAIENILARMPPNTEKLFSAEPSLRWRLAFGLNYGRLLAQKVRAFEYNSALAQIKSTYTESDINSKVNHLIFRPDKELNYAPSAKKQAKIAEELLQRVIKEAPGTPWELMAKRELKDGFGIRILERFDKPPPAQPKAEGKAKPGPKILAEQQKAQPKTPPPKPVEPVLPKL